ncbi:MAG: hypothetical protein CM15mP49_25750 [Actinomycetota bacterium]|nr:MAG: hypothetical protein CM15mP49_25750 [Actinomycetota bacterium]
MPIESFVEYALPSLKQRYYATQHRVSNIRVEIKDDKALVESYVLAYHVEMGETPSSCIPLTEIYRYVRFKRWALEDK